jgi:DNA-binding response OmpR family regulator
VFKLRSKLEADQQHPRHFITAYGTGYRFAV